MSIKTSSYYEFVAMKKAKAACIITRGLFKRFRKLCVFFARVTVPGARRRHAAVVQILKRFKGYVSLLCWAVWAWLITSWKGRTHSRLGSENRRSQGVHWVAQARATPWREQKNVGA